MQLIADSGSTKTDWRLIDSKGKISQVKTVGFNPYHQSSEDITERLQKELLPQITAEIETIHFYGAGCFTDLACQTVKDALKNIFPKSKAEVHNDLLAAARALCGHQPGIACIIGTGANSCLYDGNKIMDNIPPLGYIMGDEGSATWLGKQLLNSYFKRWMPKELRPKFEKRFSPSVGDALENVYRQPQANRYLAQFSRFAFHYLKHPWVAKLVYDGFNAFFDKNIVQYTDYQQQPIHFTGGVAFYYANLLRQVANDRGVRVQNILESPIAGLTLFHQGE
ncbi:BadF/BadG/BcrA/BcrD ATPase family protein [Tunicatimonas pelagia]|uniref:BadF/BadG/BcrA/BcrD ATPase family protein n=1 Tax=Tunicatimonas pelagia TaxID=931531 RepID=UPI0026653333|nr:BadF/BadG/BcrA/BcrD ATPase family protein [Tunicatimonas pelagia]WKN41033.1 N-acetylglucosamine kinase [Tunicatimonas pelagia]